MAEFSLVGLVPESDTFRHPDGTVYEVRKAIMFGVIEYAAFERLNKATPALMDKLNTAPEGARDAAAREATEHIDSLVSTLMPTMPIERVRALPFSKKIEFISWWRKQQEQAAPGEAPAGQQSNRSRRGRRSPASSTSTA